ncbi:Lrp/AsnC family transcriptional regulator [Candidatus Bathyarchaeota archaeon]|nr:MAG: Lrp/AsnC family transcriptional regulator [Candidatus Bathyarchaeota archaeon]RJS81680.1 MAG: Lrp/AsnC family transcriptional regulator [Candidatus Bathyarchaeota archaeon]RLI17729.1 MAG: AsnC family transcriptional regulator [Candidatus Bathyarchaeota archaeon]HDD69777.1 Lrp/AsnC family transcriptional regulator [Candidatus Bathyarchaeota archaeon]
MEALTRRSMQILRMLYEKGKATSTYTLNMKQEELAKELGISRQALNVHLRKLRDLNYIRTGRGFIDVTEKGLNTLGISATPAFIFIKVSPHKRIYAYKKIKELIVQRAFRITGDVDALLIVDREKLDEVLKRLSSIEGIQDTKSYVAIETMK